MLQLNGGQRYSFGLFVTAIGIIALLILLTSCRDKQLELPIPPPVIVADTISVKDTSTTTAPVGGYKYLALGDSYTIGQGVPEEGRFPMQVAAILNAKGIPVSKPAIIAQTGWPTATLLTAIEQANPAPDNDIVTLLIGVNDQYQSHDTTGYRSKFTTSLEKAIQLAKGKRSRVFVLSIPDYSVTPFGMGAYASQTALEIDQFNAINKAVTLSYNISYTDITPISRAAKGDATMLASDGLHPSGSQYRLWAEQLVIPIITQLK
ncbi:MAG: SGNH/GDSL hydrolase family protein [Bacteroidota bacterium]